MVTPTLTDSHTHSSCGGYLLTAWSAVGAVIRIRQAGRTLFYIQSFNSRLAVETFSKLWEKFVVVEINKKLFARNEWSFFIFFIEEYAKSHFSLGKRQLILLCVRHYRKRNIHCTPTHTILSKINVGQDDSVTLLHSPLWWTL